MTEKFTKGQKVLVKFADEKCFRKRVVIDYLPSSNMIAFGDNEYSDAFIYFNLNILEIVNYDETN